MASKGNMEPLPRSYYRNLKLDEFQQRAIAAIEAHKSVIVSAPTGSGKTLIADFAVERILGRSGQKCIYTAPLKALSNQKYRDYCSLLSPDQVGIMTGDVVININAPFLIMTTEVLLNLLHREMSRVERVGCVIFDELHFLANEDRGTVWEETLVLLPPKIPIVGLSATIANIDEVCQWLRTIKETEVVSIKHNTRPVPLKIFGFSHETGLRQPEEVERFRRETIIEFQETAEYRRLKRKSEEERGRGARRGRRYSRRFSRKPSLYHGLFQETTHVDIVEHLEEKELLPCLFFVFSRRKCELMGQELGFKDFLTPNEKKEVRAFLKDRLANFEGYTAVKRIRELLLRGIGYHHAGIFPFLKEVVETLYEMRLIRVLYCTSTFALGVNFPARTACFQSVVKFDGHQSRVLTPLEFFQKAGRAGRRGIDEVGYVVIRRNLRSSEKIPTFAESDIQPIQSALNLSYNSVVNLLETYSIEQIDVLLRDSFWQFQTQEKVRSLRNQVDQILADLLRIDGVEISHDKQAVVRRTGDLRRELRSIQTKVDRLKQSRRPDPRELDKQNDLLTGLQQQLTTLETLRILIRSRGSHGRKRVPKLRRRLHRIAEEIHYYESHLMRTFRERCRVLEHLGFLTEDYRFNNGAHLVKVLHIQELLVAELILSGMLDDLDMPHLNALLCCIGQSEKRRGENQLAPVPISRSHLRRIREILRRLRAAGAEQVDPIEINFDYAIVGMMWSRGASFSELLELSNLDEGDIISCFRQTIDLIKQLKDVYREDEKMLMFLNTCIDGMDRDVVRVVL